MVDCALNVDATIEKLVSVKNSKPGTEVNLPEHDIIWLCKESKMVRTERRESKFLIIVRAQHLVCFFLIAESSDARGSSERNLLSLVSLLDRRGGGGLAMQTHEK